jgi:membrane-bound metal-dependent hydrolase YbcI (DUF457 family)
MKNKKGLNKMGHVWFGLIIGLLGFYMLKDFMSISTLFLCFHLPFYLIGSAYLLDTIESPKFGGRWHRGIFHSKIAFVVILLAVPILIKFYLDYPKKFFLDIPFNYFSIGIAILLGICSHIFGDSLTDKLR